MSTLRNTFADVLHKIGLEDPNLVVLVGDISHFRLQPFARDCPGRYYNIGICEPTIVNMAAGLSKVGLFPVVHTISPFIVERSFEQLKLDFCYQDLGGNIVTVGSAFDYSHLGCTHHCYSDFALLKTLPDTHLFYPATYREFDTLFRQVYNKRQLNYFRIPMHGHEFDFPAEDIVCGKAIPVNEGEDLTLVAVGSQLRTALSALEPLKKMGISIDLLYVHTIKPFDVKTVNASLTKTRRCLVIEEHGMYGGVFDDVLRSSRKIEGVQYSSLAIPNRFLRDYGSYEEHCRHLGFSTEGILKKVKEELKLNSVIASDWKERSNLFDSKEIASSSLKSTPPRNDTR